MGLIGGDRFHSRRASITEIVVYLLEVFRRMGMGFVAAGLEPLRT